MIRKVTVVAMSVDSQHIVLFQPNGETVTLLQGDPRIPAIVATVKEPLSNNQSVEVDLTPIAPVKPEYEACEKATGMKFLRVAKSFLKKLFDSESPTEVAPEVEHIRPMDIGVFPGADEKQDVILTSIGNNKVAVIKTIRVATGMGLKETHDLVSKYQPVTIVTEVEKFFADDLCAQLRVVGALSHYVNSKDNKLTQKPEIVAPLDTQPEKAKPSNDEKLAEAHAKLDMLEENSIPTSDSAFHAPLESNETIVAVHEGKVIPDVQHLQRQLKAAGKLQDYTGFTKFMERMATVVDRRRHSIEDLMKFMQHGDLPIADDGCIVIYKRLNSKSDNLFVDVASGNVKQKVGSFVFMREGLVDPDRRRDCSNGLHVATLGYLSSFSGNVTIIGKVRPEDVIAVPEYSHTKMRVCGYHVLAKLSDEQRKLVNRGGSICDAEGGAELLNAVLRGNHTPITQHVEIGGSHGSNLTITDIAVPVAVDQTVADIRNTTLDMGEPLEAEAPKAEPVKATDIKPVNKVENLKVVETKAQKVQRLYQDYKSTGAASVAAELVALKKASKCSWTKLGLSEEAGKLLIEADGQTVKPVVATHTDDFAPLPKAKGSSRQADAKALWETFCIDEQSVAAVDALLAFKKKCKVSWEKLGFTEAQVKKLMNANAYNHRD